MEECTETILIKICCQDDEAETMMGISVIPNTSNGTLSWFYRKKIKHGPANQIQLKLCGRTEA